MNIQFLNVDLDITSGSDLSELAAAFGDAVTVLHSGRMDDDWTLSLEVSTEEDSADAVIRRFCDLVEALPTDATDTWCRAKRREFNVGYMCGDEPAFFDSILETETVDLIARNKASIITTIYPADEEEDSE